MENAADRKTFVVVERMLENADRKRAAVEHQMFADHAAAIGETVGKLFVGGEQEQAGSLRAIRADDHGFSFLALDVALLIEINGTGRAAIGVELDAVNIGVRTNLTAAGLLRHGNGGSKRTRFRADFAGKPKAEATIDAGAATGPGL